MGSIYCFTNLINNKKYVGQSMDQEKRYKCHKSNAFNKKSAEYNSILHRAIRKYGLENFKYEILEDNIYEINKLNELEIYCIKELNTKIPNGYNIEDGGKNASKPKTLEHRKKEIWGQAKLTEEEVVSLRISFLKRESPTEIYREKFKDRLHFNSFLNIWSGKRYSLIMPEVFEITNKHTKLNENIVKKIRKRERRNGFKLFCTREEI